MADTKSVAAVHTMAVKNDIEMNNDLMMLSLVDHVTSDFRAPSWVADFNRAITTSDFNEVRRHSKYETGFSSTRTFSPDDMLLCVDGFQVDLLATVDIEERVGEITIDSLLDNRNLSWPWNIETITNKLKLRGTAIKEDGREMDDSQGRSDTSEDLARSIRRIVYEVIIAGQVFKVDTRWKTHVVEYVSPSDPLPKDWRFLLSQAEDQTRGRTLVLSERNYLGLAPFLAQPGDAIFILSGLREPAILRPSRDGAYHFIGTAYIHGIMNGEALEAFYRGVFKRERVTLR